jgi:anti-sigma factor RsiW
MKEHEILLARADAAVLGLPDPAPPPPLPPLPRRTIAIGIAALVLCLAALGVLIRQPSLSETVVAQFRVVPGQPGLDSDDPAALRTWIAAQTGIDLAPPPGLAAQGFALTGARATHIGRRPAAALLYRAQNHRVMALVWRSANALEAVVRYGRQEGIAWRHWPAGALGVWAATDGPPALLEAMARAWGPAGSHP